MKMVLVEDDATLRTSLSLLLSGERGIEMVGAFGSAEASLDALATGDVSPEVMVVDIDLPGMSGIELIRTVKADYPEVELMAFTISVDRNTVMSALKAGASGYLLKGSTPRELVEAVYAVHEGGAPMTPRIAKRVLLELRELPNERPSLLTAREVDILTHIGEGLTPKEVAQALCISLHTVRTHLKRAYEKLQANTRQEALQKARRHGLL